MSVLQRRDFKAKLLKRQKSTNKITFKTVRSDKYSFIDQEILYNEKGKKQTGHWADYIHAFLGSSLICETMTYDVTGCTVNQVSVTLSVYVLCTQEMSRFHFQIITPQNHSEFLHSMSQLGPFFRRMTHIPIAMLSPPKWDVCTISPTSSSSSSSSSSSLSQGR